MASSNFIVKTHKFEGQHIRHYAGATRNGDSDIQYLEAKQYIPANNQNPKEGDITIIGGHATGFPKELYEPVWEDLLAQSERSGLRIRSIWIADASFQGASGVMNENTLGDDPSWSDHARDTLHMTNVFREHMVPPIVGIAHSMGATTLIELSLMHPRLFASLVLIDPIIGLDNMTMGQKLIYLASIRPDLFPTREAAEKGFRKAFRAWDPRTFSLWMQHGLRDTPTALYPKPGMVTLTTTKANEAWSLGRPQYEDPAADGTLTKSGRIKYPDANPIRRPFYATAIEDMYEGLDRLRPDVLYMAPEKSIATKPVREALLNRIGIAFGGSGGVKEGRVAMAVVQGSSHLCTFEKPAEVARIISEWLNKDIKAWKERAEYERQNRDDKSSPDKLRVSKEWTRQAKVFFEMSPEVILGKPKL